MVNGLLRTLSLHILGLVNTIFKTLKEKVTFSKVQPGNLKLYRKKDDKNTHIWGTETKDLGGENYRTVTDVSKISCVGK